MLWSRLKAAINLDERLCDGICHPHRASIQETQEALVEAEHDSSANAGGERRLHERTTQHRRVVGLHERRCEYRSIREQH